VDVSGAAKRFGVEWVDWKNGDLTIKSDGFTIKNGDVTIKNSDFPHENKLRRYPQQPKGWIFTSLFEACCEAASIHLSLASVS
jgi:hypothetical protein